MSIEVATTREELASSLALLDGRVGLVMTMGALHEGHISLVHQIKQLVDHVVVSIFVNPTQFAPGEDFDAYPRTLESDLEKLAEEGGVDLVFAPATDDVMYPQPVQFTLDPGPIAKVLEGATRPTHFQGVALVVTKVFGLVRPDVAIFGQKDAQQLAMLRLLVRDLDLPVEIIQGAIVREDDGLAMSSRNRYLSADEREQALALSRSVEAGRIAGESGADGAGVIAATRAVLDAEPGVDVDYVALRSVHDFSDLAGWTPGDAPTGAFVLVAAKVGKTRLIDNAVVSLGGSADGTVGGSTNTAETDTAEEASR